MPVSLHNNNSNNNIDDIMSSSSDISNAYCDQKTRMRSEEERFYHAAVTTTTLEEEVTEEDNHNDSSIWALLSGVGGNIYEWYDFAVYGLLAPEIGNTFFPDTLSPELQLMNSFGVYLAAFFMRPLGAIVFGEMGDRAVGRKHALVMSIVLITVPSVLMGMLPGYNVWGSASPILLILLRMLQGLSVGGQLAGSYVLTIEQSHPSTRGFRGAVCDASSVGGFLLASIVTTTVRNIWSEEAVDAWAWRIPFWFSLVLAPMLYWIVRNTKESNQWTETQQQQQQLEKEEASTNHEQQQQQQQSKKKEKGGQLAIFDLFRNPFQRRQLFGMIGVLSGFSSAFYILFLWTPVYISELRDMVSEAEADLLNIMVVSIYIVMLLVQGYWSDASFDHRRDLLRIGFPGLIVATPVMLYLFEATTTSSSSTSNNDGSCFYSIFVAQILMGFCLSMIQGCIGAYEVECWMADPSVSFTGVAIGHNFASLFFGGTLPLIATSLVVLVEAYDDDDTHSYWSHHLLYLLPGLYISLLGCLSLYCLSNVVRHPHDIRTGVYQANHFLQKLTPTGWMEEHPFVYHSNSSGSQQQGEKGEEESYQPPVSLSSS